jgi:hypothetical protein
MCLLALLLIGALWLTVQTTQVRAIEQKPELSEHNISSGSEPNENCLMCHTDPDFKGSFQNGELISLFVDSGEYEQSVHGPAGLNCVACHTAISRYPHHSEEQVTCVSCHPAEGGQADTEYVTLRVQLTFADRRGMTLTINEACRSCHEREFEVAVDSAHVKVFEGGNLESPVCVDCHGSHAISRPEEPRPKISRICGECHKAVYSTYRSSIHGAALNAESNPDVPTCVECHGVHSVRGPRDSDFRNDSITICGDCHANQEMMDKYGVSTDVFKTYLADFHGRTVDLFRRQDGNPSNKAVCFDCHGIHNIRSADDPLSTIYPENLQHTCEQCHTNASIRFPQAWLSHYLPTWDETPGLVVVNWVYRILVPLTIGGFLAYIGLDVSKRWRDKRQVLLRARAIAEAELEDYDFTHGI